MECCGTTPRGARRMEMMAVIAWKDEWAEIEEFCLDDVCIV